MLLYLDTSAFLPLVVAENGSPLCVRLWLEAERIASSRLLLVESTAALAQARRMGRLTTTRLADCLAHAAELLENMSFIEVTAAVIAEAQVLAVRHTLRGYDAVQLATSMLVRGPDSAVASGDRRLLRAWADVGFTHIDTGRG